MSKIEFQCSEIEGLVSVIIPTRSCDRFIGATLDSIGNQTYKRWELIVVEDGPAGRTRPIVEKFASNFPESSVKFHCNDRNYGASFSRNVGFTKAAGEFVALLDSDDRWTPDHLEAAVKALQADGKEIVYSTVMLIADQTEMPLGTWGPDESDLREFPRSIIGRNYITPSSTVMRRQVLADVGPWNTKMIYCEDYEYWLRCIRAGKQFQWIGGCHCLYRKNHAGATTQKICGTLEEVADVTARFLDLPGVRLRVCQRLAAKAYDHAARFHCHANPAVDPSADYAHAATLLMKAWRLRPTYLEYLWKAGKIRLTNLLHRRPRATVAPPSVLSAALEAAPPLPPIVPAVPKAAA